IIEYSLIIRQQKHRRGDDVEKEHYTDLNKQINRARRNTLGDILARTRERMPNKLALRYKDQRKTYAELDDLVNQTAHGFNENGLEKGDMVTVMSKNSLDFIIVKFALARIGAVMITINYMLSVEDVQYILDHAEVCGLIASEEYAPVLDESVGRLNIKCRYLMDVQTVSDRYKLHRDWEPLKNMRQNQSTYFIDVTLEDDNLAQVLYTSGTESRPKGVMLTHKSLISEYVSCIIDGGMEERDILVHALPLYHSAQLHVFLGPSIYLGS